MSQSNTDNNQIILGYWKIRGLVEPCRLALHYTHTSYIEKMYEQGEGPEYDREEWLSEKEKLDLGKSIFIFILLNFFFSYDLDFPNLPYMFHGDLKITQSKAILYYLGRKLNLMGKNSNEEAYVMMLCEEAHDLRMKLNEIFYGSKGDSQEVRKQFAETTLSEHLKKFDNYLGKHNTKFAVGNQPTVADFQLYEYIDCGLSLEGGQALLEKYSNIKRFLKTIRELPEIKEYIAKVHTQLPLNNKGKYCRMIILVYFL